MSDTPTIELPSIHKAHADGPTRAVVLVLHGGKSESQEPTEDAQLSVVRLRPFATRVHRLVKAHGVAVWRVRYRVRGWNGHQASPTHDVRGVLDQVRAEHGAVPVVLLGHSLGGRTAIAVCDDPSVRHVVALAPWLPAGEPFAQAADRDVVIAHAPHDRWTSPRETRQWADRAQDVAAQVTYITVPRSGHFMLRRHRVWGSIASAFTLRALAAESVTDAGLITSVSGPGPNLVAEAAGGRHSLQV